MVVPAKFTRHQWFTLGYGAIVLTVIFNKEPSFLSVRDLRKLLEELPLVRIVAIRADLLRCLHDLETDLDLRMARVNVKVLSP